MKKGILLLFLIFASSVSMARVLIIPDPSGDGFIVLPRSSVNSDVIFYNYNPDSTKILDGLIDKKSISVIGIKDSTTGATNSLSRISVNSIDNPLDDFIMELDSESRPIKIITPYGESTFEYLANNIVSITATNSAGETETFTVEIPASPIAANSEPSVLLNTLNQQPTSQEAAESSCDMRELFSYEKKSGQMIFRCDDNYYQDTDEKFRPYYISAEYSHASFDTLKGNLGLTLDFFDADNNPEKSIHSYEYDVEIPTKIPSYKEWRSCCNKINPNDVLDIALEKTLQIYNGTKTVKTSITLATCLAGAATVAGAVPACTPLIASIAANAVIDSLQDLSIGVCGLVNYNAEIQRQKNFNHIDVTVLENNARSLFTAFLPDDQYIQTDLDFLSEPELPDINIGPTEPKDVDLVILDSNEQPFPYLETWFGGLEVPENSVLNFRAFDNFYDRSKNESMKEQTQHYYCADYKWTLERDGKIVFIKSQGTTREKIETIPLQVGNYTIKLEVDNEHSAPPIIVQDDFRVSCSREGNSNDFSHLVDNMDITFTVDLSHGIPYYINITHPIEGPSSLGPFTGKTTYSHPCPSLSQASWDNRFGIYVEANQFPGPSYNHPLLDLTIETQVGLYNDSVSSQLAPWTSNTKSLGAATFNTDPFYVGYVWGVYHQFGIPDTIHNSSEGLINVTGASKSIQWHFPSLVPPPPLELQEGSIIRSIDSNYPIR